MLPGDAPDDEMRDFWNAVPPLDAATAERMLDGTVHQDDVPPDYRDVLRVLAAAAAPAAAPPAAEAAALAAFRSTRRPVDPRRRNSVLSKLLGAKAVAALVLGTATVGTAAAAAAGALPDRAQAKAHSIVTAIPDADRSDRAAEAALDAGSGGHGRAGAAAALPGAAGLCQAYGSGSGGDTGKRLDSTGFGRLAAAAGGADKIPAYCGTVAAAATRAAGGPDQALAGACRSWLAATAAGRAPGQAVVDRLVKAAGSTEAVASYCAALVGDDKSGGSTAAHPTPQPTPGPTPQGDRPTEPPAKGHASGTPTHPAPPTHRD
jgi:hypothetical protein